MRETAANLQRPADWGDSEDEGNQRFSGEDLNPEVAAGDHTVAPALLVQRVRVKEKQRRLDGGGGLRYSP